MTRTTIPALFAATMLTLVLAACGSSSSSTAPTGAPAASAAAPSAAAAACAVSTTAGTVAVAIKDFAFSPAQVSAKVGDVIAFSNGDSTAHTATLDDGSCTTGDIAPGTTSALVITAPGTYPFHCSIHTSMKGTITVS
jgi:plastocyanin